MFGKINPHSSVLVSAGITLLGIGDAAFSLLRFEVEAALSPVIILSLL